MLAAATGAFSVLVSWYYQPYFAPGNQALGLYEMSPFATLFSLRGVAFPAWTLAAFAIGALAGMLIRRVVPAIVATLAAYAGLAVATGGLLREHYLTPLLTTATQRARHRVDHQPVVDQGRQVRLRRQSPRQPRQPVLLFRSSGAGQGGLSLETFAQCLSQHGYTQWTSYQPASRFWPFQWIEGGWLLALSALLIAATIWLVRRRAA